MMLTADLQAPCPFKPVIKCTPNNHCTAVVQSHRCSRAARQPPSQIIIVRSEKIGQLFFVSGPCGGSGPKFMNWSFSTDDMKCFLYFQLLLGRDNKLLGKQSVATLQRMEKGGDKREEGLSKVSPARNWNERRLYSRSQWP